MVRPLAGLPAAGKVVRTLQAATSRNADPDHVRELASQAKQALDRLARKGREGSFDWERPGQSARARMISEAAEQNKSALDKVAAAVESPNPSDLLSAVQQAVHTLLNLVLSLLGNVPGLASTSPASGAGAPGA